MNVLYDLLTKTYVDAGIQKARFANEHKVFVEIVDRLEDFFPILIMADHGYESYNNLAHLQEKGHFFLIRVKDAASKNGIAHGFSLPDGSFDRQFHLSLSRKQTNETKQLFRDKESFRIIPATSAFDLLPLKRSRHSSISSISASFAFPYRKVPMKPSSRIYLLIPSLRMKSKSSMLYAGESRLLSEI